jgi:hypothetical protein
MKSNRNFSSEFLHNLGVSLLPMADRVERHKRELEERGFVSFKFIEEYHKEFYSSEIRSHSDVIRLEIVREILTNWGRRAAPNYEAGNGFRSQLLKQLRLERDKAGQGCKTPAVSENVGSWKCFIDPIEREDNRILMTDSAEWNKRLEFMFVTQKRLFSEMIEKTCRGNLANAVRNIAPFATAIPQNRQDWFLAEKSYTNALFEGVSEILSDELTKHSFAFSKTLSGRYLNTHVRSLSSGLQLRFQVIYSMVQLEFHVSVCHPKMTKKFNDPVSLNFDPTLSFEIQLWETFPGVGKMIFRSPDELEVVLRESILAYELESDFILEKLLAAGAGAEVSGTV